MSTKAKRELLKLQRNSNKCQIEDFIHEHGFEMEHINEYQIRINNTVDVYPTAKRCFFLKTKRWGNYNKIEELLKFLV